jgi:hypothetical protein
MSGSGFWKIMELRNSDSFFYLPSCHNYLLLICLCVPSSISLDLVIQHLKVNFRLYTLSLFLRMVHNLKHMIIFGIFHSIFLFIFVFLRHGSYYIAQAGLKCQFLLLQPLKFWDHRYATPHLFSNHDWPQVAEITEGKTEDK